MRCCLPGISKGTRTCEPILWTNWCNRVRLCNWTRMVLVQAEVTQPPAWLHMGTGWHGSTSWSPTTWHSGRHAWRHLDIRLWMASSDNVPSLSTLGALLKSQYSCPKQTKVSIYKVHDRHYKSTPLLAYSEFCTSSLSKWDSLRHQSAFWLAYSRLDVNWWLLL